MKGGVALMTLKGIHSKLEHETCLKLLKILANRFFTGKIFTINDFVKSTEIRTLPVLLTYR